MGPARSERPTLRVAGLMSGTSADGVDVAITEIGPKGIRVLAFDTTPYPRGVRAAVFRLFDPKTSDVDDLCRMNFVLGECFARALIGACRRHRIPLASLHLIGSHGQTVRHLPRRGARRAAFAATLQIGEPCVIAERTGVTTVADFRPRDIAAGGQGAPLVPLSDYVLFRHPRRNRVVQNIGGIANATWLPRHARIGDVIAFDTGPGNMILDRLAQRLTRGRLSYDTNGCLAARGRVVTPILNALLRHPYLRRRPPKSTGREEFGAPFADDLLRAVLRRRARPEDALATAAHFTALSIAEAYRRFLPGPVDEVILCGGGARNPVLVRLIRDAVLPARVLLMDDLGLNADAKEAVSFALLAYETFCGRAGNVPSATGARRPVVLGKIVPGRACSIARS